MIRRIVMTLAAVAVIAFCAPASAQVMGGRVMKGQPPQKVTPERSILRYVTSASNIVNPARIGKNLPTGIYWTQPSLDFTGADIWYFSPDVTSGGTGTKADPFPSLSASIAADIAAGGAGTAYIEKRAVDGELTWDGHVQGGDVIALMKGDHGGAVLDSYYNTNFIAIYGMRGAHVDSLYLWGARKWVLENVEFRQKREDFAAPNLTPYKFLSDAADTVNGLLDDYNIAPRLLRSNWRAGGNKCRNIIVNNCTFWAGDDFRTRTRDEWTQRAPDAIGFLATDSSGVYNSTFKGINYSFVTNNDSYVDFNGNTVNGFCGDMTLSGAYGSGYTFSYAYIANNRLYDMYQVNVNHIDAIGEIWDGTDAGSVHDVTFDGNVFVMTTDKGRNSEVEATTRNPTPSHFYVWSDDGNANNDWRVHTGIAMPNWLMNTDRPIEDLHVINNVISMQSLHGITTRASCDSCEFVNNTVVPLWAAADAPAGLLDDQWGNGVYFSREDSATAGRNVYNACVLANNVAGFVGFSGGGTANVTKSNNYTLGFNTANVAGFLAHDTGTNWPEWNLTPAYGSPLVDAGSATYAPSTDLNGTARPIGWYDDIGAIESPDYKLLTELVISNGDTAGGYVFLSLGGTIATTSGSLEVQDKVAGGTFADAGTYPLSDNEIAFSYLTEYPDSILPDTLYARARLTYGGRTGPWDESSLYVEIAAVDDTIPVATFAWSAYDSLQATDKIRLKGKATADEDASWRFALVDVADTPDTTFGAWTPEDSLVAAGDTISVVMATGDDPENDKAYTLLAWAKDAAGNISAPDTANFSIQRAPQVAAEGDTVVYVFSVASTTGFVVTDHTIRARFGPRAGWSDSTAYQGTRTHAVNPTTYYAGFDCADSNSTAVDGANTLGMQARRGVPFTYANTDKVGLLNFGAAIGDSLDGGTVLSAALYVYYGAIVPTGTWYYVGCTAAGIYDWRDAAESGDVSWSESDATGTNVYWTPRLDSYANVAAIGPSTSFAGVPDGYTTAYRQEIDFTSQAQAWADAPTYAGIVLMTGTHSINDSATVGHFNGAATYDEPFLVIRVVKP